MLQGSSALQSIPNSSVKTPQLRITATANRTLTSVPTFLTGMQGIRDSIIFNNKLVVIGGNNTGGTIVRSMMRVFSPDGLTQYAGITIYGRSDAFDAIGDAGFLAASFQPEGATLNLFFNSLVGATERILRISSSDAVSWGGTVVVAVVATGITNNQELSVTADIAAVGSSQVYFLKSEFLDGYGLIVSRLHLARDSGTWGTTEVSNYPHFLEGPYVPELRRYRSVLSGFKENGVDHLFVNRLDTSTDSLQVSLPEYRGGKVSMSQGLYHYSLRENSLFSQEELIAPASIEDTESIPTSFFFSNTKVSKGVSLYYIGLRFLHNIDIYWNNIRLIDKLQGGVTVLPTSGYDYAYSYSADLTNWSAPIPLSISPQSYLMSPIAAGTSSNLAFEAMILGTSYANLFDLVTSTEGSTGNIVYTHSGGSPMDISSDIISYSNADNRRISLTLGNYK